MATWKRRWKLPDLFCFGFNVRSTGALENKEAATLFKFRVQVFGEANGLSYGLCYYLGFQGLALWGA